MFKPIQHICNALRFALQIIYSFYKRHPTRTRSGLCLCDFGAIGERPYVSGPAWKTFPASLLSEKHSERVFLEYMYLKPQLCAYDPP